jgi:hypothetical protein
MPMSWGEPLLIDSLERPINIARLGRQMARGGDGGGYKEALLQHLIHTMPDCLPVKEIDPAFAGLKAVCTELPLHEDVWRRADNLLITPEGRLCLVECKLASNPESNRDVLAQLLDYAEVLSRLDYDALRDRVRRATGGMGDPIIDAVLGPGTDPELAEDLVVGIERSLQHGEMLLLIVGDRIQARTRRLVDLLEERVNLGFTFGLIEMPVYAATGLGYVIQPRVVLKTTEIRRTVFVAAGAGSDLAVRKVEQRERGTLGEEEFYARLAQADPSFPSAVKGLLDRLVELGCDVQLLRKYNVYLDDGLGGRLNVLSIANKGAVFAWAASARDQELGEPVGYGYLAKVASFLPGAALAGDSGKPGSWHVRVDNKPTIDLRLLLAHQEAWLAAIGDFRDRLLEIQRKRDGQ